MGSNSTNNGVTAKHPVLVATAVYAALCVPAYFLLEGPVGTAGTVDGSVVVGGLLLGSILIVPMIRAVLRDWGVIGTDIDVDYDTGSDETAY